MSRAEEIYSVLLHKYGKQGWWPIVSSKTGTSEYGTGAPADDGDRFEIVIGAILTQNVAWKNVEKALASLKKKKILSPKKLHRTGNQVIAECIRPAGYYNQKAIKIKNFLDWFAAMDYSFEEMKKMKTGVLRERLLEINGVGPETADSILLYAMERKIFVTDAYTKRIFSRLDLTSPDDSYDTVQKFFHDEFSGTVKKYNEFHALIVAHGKDICKNKPLCEGCCLSHSCTFQNRISE